VPKGIKADADLDLLTVIERGEVITQQKLKSEIGVSVGLVNALIKRALRTGLVKARQAPYKRYAYYLTPKGFSEKSRLVARYLENSLAFYRRTREEYAGIFRQARDLKLRRVVLVGGGELTEIAVLAAACEQFELLAIVEPGANVDKRYGVPIVPSVESIWPIDGAIVTDSCSPQETYELLRKPLPEGSVFAPSILRINPARAKLRQRRNTEGEGGIVMDWYVVSTHPHQEERAQINLRRQGYEVWTPMLERTRKHARRTDIISAPLFPGYLFVSLDCKTEPWRAIDSTFGVRRILCRGEHPCPVQRGFIETLKAATDDRGVLAMTADNIEPGQPVRVLDGPFADQVGTLLRLANKERIALLLNLLGREVEVEVSRRQVVAIA
jgi:transcription elongation factor/antiterminator RfaH